MIPRHDGMGPLTSKEYEAIFGRRDYLVDSINEAALLDERRELWRWHFAGQLCVVMDSANFQEDARSAVKAADALIAELEKERK